MRFLIVLLGAVVCLRPAHLRAAPDNTNAVTADKVSGAADMFGLSFSPEKIQMMLPGLREQLNNYQAIHRFPLSNGISPALQFNPIPVGMKFNTSFKKARFASAGKVKLPVNPDDLAFYSIGQLAELIRARKLSSETLTRLCLERLKTYGPKLECVVTLTPELALRQAARADAEVAHGHYRGLLHGIPYAAKDLFAVAGYPTTWGAAPYTNQVFERDATVIQKLEKAGAVLVAKTTLGELAMGETWFGGMTRNPWDLKQGSSGSSAGSAAATAAGLVPFAIGSETLGSIMSPADRCGLTGLRPTYGRVSRAGAMTLSWSMDKVGPLCRSVEDCAIVFNAIQGPDGLDQTVYDLPFNYRPGVDLKRLRIAYLQKDFEAEKGERRTNDFRAIEVMRKLGAKLTAVELPNYPVGNISFLLSTEGAAAFEDLTRTGRDDLLKQQDADSWPNSFRKKRFVPAVEYLQAQRIRYLLIQDMARMMTPVDVLIAPTFGGKALLESNLTGNPSVCVPDGFTAKGAPTSICFIGKLFDEATMLAVAKCYQEATGFHLEHPKGFER